MPLEVGMQIGVYSVIAKIGEGGMGQVYRVRCEGETKILIRSQEAFAAREKWAHVPNCSHGRADQPGHCGL